MVLLRDLHSVAVVSSNRGKEPFSELVCSILPLLIECWLEVCAASPTSRDEDTLVTMMLVVQITLQTMAILAKDVNQDKVGCHSGMSKNVKYKKRRFLLNLSWP